MSASTEILMSRNALEQDIILFQRFVPIETSRGVYQSTDTGSHRDYNFAKMSPSREGCERITLNGIPMGAMFVDNVIKDEKRARILTIRTCPDRC